MATCENDTFDTRSAASIEQRTRPALLRSEIRFWRELIETCQETEPPDRIERMRDALALAESKLRERLQPRLSVVTNESLRPSNLRHASEKPGVGQ